VSVTGGYADYYFHSAGGKHLTAALVPKVPTANGTGQLYGRYSVRARFPAGLTGFHVAFLLWPDDGIWPAHGEIDWPDHQLSDDTKITGFVHYATATGAHAWDRFVITGQSLAAWHTYTTEWTPTYVKLYLDSTLVGTETAHVPPTSMHWVLQTDSCGSTVNDTSSGHAQIAWATVDALVTPPVNTLRPQLTCPKGCANVFAGQTISATLGTWTGANQYGWTWQRCPATGGCTNITTKQVTSDANLQPTYVLATADVGFRVRIHVTATATGSAVTAAKSSATIP
jgi:hypothetical protein